jgi:hypothetical protein
LYLTTLSRLPTADELAKAAAFIDEADSREAGVQDVLWVLLNVREFLFVR